MKRSEFRFARLPLLVAMAAALHAQEPASAPPPAPPPLPIPASQTAPPPAESAAPAPAPGTRPLPDIAALMHDVEAQERIAEAAQKNYIYREATRFDVFNSHDGVKKTEEKDYEVFWLNGVRVARLVRRNGKELSPEEKAKEDEHIDQVVAKAKERRARADAQGKLTDSHGREQLSVSRILELGSFSNARRVQVNGRDTIVVDYQGDPQAKTHNSAEGAFRELAGTVWVDEGEKAIQHLEGHFVNDFKLMGGMAVDVKKGTWFKATFTRINDEVWLPEFIEGDGHARYLLFFTLNGHFSVRTSDYRKFKATSTILPDFTQIDPETPEGRTGEPQPAKPEPPTSPKPPL